jgi:tetratricopeptide (TPR) repeat protein
VTDMPFRLIAYRIVSARRALHEAPSEAECLPALGAMVEAACELREDDLGGTGAARARSLLDESVSYLRAVLVTLPVGSGEHCLALYLLARACLRRDDAAGLLADADEAIACLRRLLAALPAEDPDRTEVEALLADALLTRSARAAARAADVDEAGRLLASVLAALPPEHPGRRPVTAALALARGLRYLAFGGTDDDRDAAEAYATATLAGPSEPDEPSATAHLMLAWTALTRQQTAEQRSTMLRQTEIETARLDAEAAAKLLTAYGEPRIAAADAETAISHLRQVPPDSGSPFTRTSVPLLWGLAQLALMGAGTEVADGGQVADSLGVLAGDPATTETERGELLAIRAALLAGQSETGAAGALGDAASELPHGHLLRSPVLRMLSLVLTRQVDQTGPADDLSARLDEVATVLDRLPHDDPEAAHAMTVLGMHVLNASVSNRNVLRQDRLFAQFERLAADLAPDDPLAPYAVFMVSSARHVRANLDGEPERADGALSDMIRHADQVPAGHPARPFALFGVATAYAERLSINGDLRNLELADKAIERALSESAPGGLYAPGSELHGHLLYLRGHLRAMRAVYNPSLPRVKEAVEELERAEAALGPAQSSRLGVITSLGAMRLLREQLTQPADAGMAVGPDASDTFDRLLAEAERAGRDSLEYPVLATQAAAGLMMRGLAAGDVTLVDRAVALVAGVCAIPTLGLRERPRMLEFHGQALHTRYFLTRDPRDLGNAIARFEEARRAVEQLPGSPHMASVLQSLASAYRSRGNQARGDVDRAVRIGLEGLRERARNVLLQDSDDNALDAARLAVNDATEMARWFLARGCTDAAVSAIELGRGMVLHAATWGTGVAKALAEAGYPELAREWTAQATRAGGPLPGGLLPDRDGELPQDDDLRYRAMLALEGTPAQARLLSPPTVADITAALAGSGADALVYLLPQDDGGLGTAVLVDCAGTVSSLPLFRLREGTETPAGEFLRTRRAVERAAEAVSDAGIARPPAPAALAAAAAFEAARADWLEALDTVCDWAWQAAIGPLLRTLAKGAEGSSGRSAGPPRRIVLVPGGKLGLVPWHAARHRVGGASAGGGPARYDCAVQHAVISYASSARQFIDAARRGPRPWPQAPVLISDADASLTYAMTEVAHLHAAHYANGAVFGSARYLLPDSSVPGAVAAGPGDVLEALPHGPHPGASVLHFGCHGRVRVPVLGSSLRLGADPRGGEVSVSVADILRQARTGPARGNGSGLVVLASCLTDVTETDYDETVTLATAFLAAGSAGVVAARWSVPETATALIMAAFHRFLNEGDRDPAQALREAQLWMLDPDREVPGSWPDLLRDEASLDGRPDGPNLTSTEAWAGFTYQGR